MKRKRKRRIRINYKRFTLSMTIIFLIMFSGINLIKKLTVKNQKNKNVVYAKHKNKKKSSNNDKIKNVKKENNNEKLDNNKNGQTIEKKEKTSNNTNNISNKEFYKNSLFIGDSITESMSFYGFLDGKNVAGIKGLTVNKAINQINEIMKDKPEKVFILLGDNDLGYGMSGTEFASQYGNLIKIIKEKDPNCEVYIQSVLLITKKAEASNPLMKNDRVNEFNEALKSLAKNNNIGYIDINVLLQNDGQKYYEPDGIHPKSTFYNVWLDYVKNKVINS